MLKSSHQVSGNLPLSSRILFLMVSPQSLAFDWKHLGDLSMIDLSLQMFFVFSWYFSTYLLSVFGFERLHIKPSYPVVLFRFPSQMCNVPLSRLVRVQSGLNSAAGVCACVCRHNVLLPLFSFFLFNCITSLILTRCFCSVFFCYWSNTKVLNAWFLNTS